MLFSYSIPKLHVMVNMIFTMLFFLSIRSPEREEKIRWPFAFYPTTMKRITKHTKTKHLYDTQISKRFLNLCALQWLLKIFWKIGNVNPPFSALPRHW